MPHGNLARELAQSALKLQQATRIRCGHRRGARLCDVTHFAFLKLCGHLNLRCFWLFRRAAARQKFDPIQIATNHAHQLC